MTGEPALLHAFLERSARRYGDRVAVEVPPGSGRPDRRTMTYAELDARADAVAARLGDAKGSIVAILLARDTPDLYAAQLGVLKAGAAYACIDATSPDAHARAILEDAAPVALLTDAKGVARGLPANAIDVATVAAAPRAPLFQDPTDLAYLIYTSGTTGRPKGVMIEHRSIANLVAEDLDLFGLGTADRVAQNSSPAYDSSVEETWLALAAGATLVVVDEETARLGPDLPAWLRRERITVFCPSPTMLRAMGGDTDLPSLRLLYLGGEALPQDLADRWAKGRRLENGYGPTECTVTATRATVRPGEPVAIGRPVRGMQAWILDDELREVPDGQTGELCLGGIGLARGYRNRPDLTNERFPTHPRLGRIYRTGDLARKGPSGDLYCLGRIDAQVKVRGHRIELEAVEAELLRCEGVREAACAVHEGALVAYVVPTAAAPAEASLKETLRSALPDHMVPSRIGTLDRLPTTTGGKLDRNALPKLDGFARAGSRPTNGVERRIADAFEEAVRRPAGMDDDFFTELGGDSLGAALVVSALRGDPGTAAITVRDLYEARTVAALARRARPLEAKRGGSGGKAAGRPLAATAVQCAVLLLGLLAASAAAYALGFELLPRLVGALGLPLLVLAVPILVLLGTIAFAPVSVLLAVVAKKLLIGKYRPMRAPAWGSFHVRHWIVQRFAALIPWGLFDDTVFLSLVLRALGARIGRRVHIDRGVNLQAGGWDLLTIGDDAALGREASLRLVDIDDGELVVAPVEVGARATLETRTAVGGGAAIGDDGYLTALSWLPPGARVPPGERWDGVPAAPAGPAPQAPSVSDDGMAPLAHGAIALLVRLGFAAAVFLPPLLIPALLAGGAPGVFSWLGSPHLLLGAVAAVPLGLLGEAMAVRMLGRVRPLTVSRWSVGHVRIALKCAAVEAAGNWLAGTLLWPVWLRLAGMRVGRKCEISTIVGPVPELVSVGDASFLADGIYLAGPRVHRGTVTVEETSLGRSTFLGNHVVVPSGQRLPDGLFVGVSTVTDPGARPGSAWFGHPPFEMPRRAAAVDARDTFEPPPLRFLVRLFFELLRFALPVPALLLASWWGQAVAERGFLAAPLATLLAALAACASVVALKWALLGRVRPGQHAFWSCWCARWDFVYMAWEFLARGVVSTLEGTLLLPWYLRAMGSRIGRRVLLGGGFAQVVDPDMLDLGDGATVSALFQAHTFEDRILKIDRIVVRDGATVGSGTVVFYGAEIGEGARVAPQGVVMKHERLLPGGSYAGCPIRAI